MSDHLRTMRGYLENMHIQGRTVDPEEYSEIIMASLPNSWNTYISALDTKNIKDPHELTAMIGGLIRSPWKINPNIVCFRCGKKGHVKHQCRSLNDGKPDVKEWKDKAHDASDEYSFLGDDTALVGIGTDQWLADSGCTSHIGRDKSIFSDYIKTPGHCIIGFGGVDGLGKGTIHLECQVNGKTSTRTLRNVVHAPDAPHNLISISRALESGLSVLFAD